MSTDDRYLLVPALAAVPLPPHVARIADYGARAIVREVSRLMDEPAATRYAPLAALGLAVCRGTDAERSHASDLAPIARRLLDGDRSAVPEAQAWVEAHSPEIVLEPSAEVRRLASRHDCGELLDMLAGSGHPPEHRAALLHALAVRSGSDRADDAPRDAGDELAAIAPAIVRGDPAAIAAARQWVAQYIRSPAPWESAR